MESRIILKALKHITTNQRKGQYLENVLTYCCKEFELDRPRVLHAIEVAKKDGLISEVTNNEKVSFRILDKGHQMLANSTEIVDLSAKECNQSDDCGSTLGSDFVEFKEFIHEGVLSLKALMSKQAISESEKNAKKPPIDYEAVFIRSLQDRILSLERQLDEKQKIIEKLLETRVPGLAP
eukprot:Seg924.9 transcript_id=Seg924.9/GoldUCD/mRNA.D3Y31 product="hypothetical protein" protein_id=Seg924.9/GoldUCD/D3Y31